MLRAADDFLEYAVRDTIAALELTDADEAAKQLALRYARIIDQAIIDGTGKSDTVLWHLGPELLRALESLGATPAARAAIRNARTGGDKTAPATVSWLEQQRESRSARGTRRA
jgi:hypothetical protein